MTVGSVGWVHVSNIQEGGYRGLRCAAIPRNVYATTSPVNSSSRNGKVGLGRRRLDFGLFGHRLDSSSWRRRSMLTVINFEAFKKR